MVDNKKYSVVDEVAYRLSMDRLGISKYNPITLLKRCVGYGLIGYGLVTFIMPSGSQFALIVGCGLLGIPFKKVLGKVKLYSSRLWFILCVLCSRRRLKYEINRVFLRVRYELRRLLL